MNRSSALMRLTIKYRDLADDTGWSEQELADSYSLVTDDALRLLGYEETELATADVPQADLRKYLAALDYYALQAFANALSPRVSVSLPGPAFAQRNVAFSQVQKRLEDAKATLAGLGLDPSGEQSYEIGRLTLDFLEPSCGNEFGGW